MTSLRLLGRACCAAVVVMLSLGSVPAAGAAAVTCNGLPATIVGTSGSDAILGTPGNDVISGRGGNDTIIGLGGNDTICGDGGHDALYGGDGNDVLLGGTGQDEIVGGAGTDRAQGGTDRDFCTAETRSGCEAYYRPRGGTVVVGSTQSAGTLNTLAPGGDSTVPLWIAQAWTCGVQEVDASTLLLVPDVVTALPTTANGGLRVNGDGTETVRYNIRGAAVWEDGTPVSGYDFEFTYETIMDSGTPINQQVYEDIIPESVVAGPKTFQYTLAHPTVRAEMLFGTLLPKHQIEGSDFISDYDAGWLSCGPFRVTSFTPGGQVSLAKNGRYWKTDPETGQRLPYLSGLVFKVYSSTTALLNAFKAGAAHVVIPSADPATVAGLRALAGARVEVVPGPVWEHLAFQFGDNRFLRNGESMNKHLVFRQAVAHAIDRDKIARVLTGGLVPAMGSYVDAFSPAWSHGNWRQYAYDPVLARQLVAQLCAVRDCGADGKPRAVFTATSDNATRVRLSQMLATMLRAADIDYKAQLEPSTLFYGESLDFGRFDLGDWAWTGYVGLGSLISIHDLWDPEAPPPGGQNYYRWGTPAVSGASPEGYNQGQSSVINGGTRRFADLRDLMNSTVSQGRLLSYVTEAESILADQLVFIPLYQRPSAGAVRCDAVGGYRYNSSGAFDTWNVEVWYRKDLVRLR